MTDNLAVLPSGTKVCVTRGLSTIEGIVIGRGTLGVIDGYIIQCTDGQVPNETYGYGAFTTPGDTIKVL